MKKPSKRIGVRKLCGSLGAIPGIKKNGSLKKGFKFIKGGMVVKANPKKNTKKKRK